jgi:hypothetical protein
MTASTSGSLIPAVKAAVVQLLRDADYPAQPTPYASGRPGPQVTYSDSADPEQDRIIIGDTSGEPGDQEWFTFAPSRKEDVIIAVRIVCMVPGLTAEETTERAFSLFTVFARAMLDAAQPTPGHDILDIPGIVGLAVRQPFHTDARNGEGWSCVIETGVSFQGWVAP